MPQNSRRTPDTPSVAQVQRGLGYIPNRSRAEDGGALVSIGSPSLTIFGSDTDTGLDEIGSTQGQVLYRDKSEWKALSPGTSGYMLTTGGAGANPAWAAPPTGDITGVTAGNGLSGGGTSGSVTLTINNCTFGAGAPGAATYEGALYFDTTLPAYAGYVCHGGAWNPF